LEESKENIIINKKLTETSNELKEISAKLKDANVSLMKKDKQKDEFLDTVTHELRTPITAIRASSEILYDDDEIPEELRKQFLQNIISESDRLNRLIDKILDLEKFETGRQKVNFATHKVMESLENAIEPLQQLINNKNIHVHIEGNQKLQADFDEDRIIQVVTNLISNAIKFCPEQNGLIAIAIQDKSDYVQIEVSDNGKGIAPNDFETIFDKFYQSINQNFKKPIGSGLGLAICKQIIEHHKGKIWATNNANGGACLSFTLPKIQ